MAVTDAAFNPSGSETIAAIKDASNALAALIEALPVGRRRATALNTLETASMWAVKAAAVGDN